jgi:hypothetical protein
MADRHDQIDLAALTAFDDIIDVRRPGDFAEHQMPSAIILPVLITAHFTSYKPRTDPELATHPAPALAKAAHL